MEHDPRKLRDIIADQCEARGISPFEVAKRSGIAEQYIEALLSGDTARLPAFPYIRAGLIAFADAIGIPSEVLVNKYRQEFAAMRSGASDQLPGNRFALPSYRREYIIGGALLVCVLLGFWISRSGFFGKPTLVILTPPADPSPFIVTSSTLTLSGRIDPGDMLSINGQHAPVQGDGSFSREMQLLPEINIIEFTTKRFLGRQVKEVRQVYFDQAETATTTPLGEQDTEAATSSEER